MSISFNAIEVHRKNFDLSELLKVKFTQAVFKIDYELNQ